MNNTADFHRVPVPHHRGPTCPDFPDFLELCQFCPDNFDNDLFTHFLSENSI